MEGRGAGREEKNNDKTKNKQSPGTNRGEVGSWEAEQAETPAATCRVPCKVRLCPAPSDERHPWDDASTRTRAKGDTRREHARWVPPCSKRELAGSSCRDGGATQEEEESGTTRRVASGDTVREAPCPKETLPLEARMLVPKKVAEWVSLVEVEEEEEHCDCWKAEKEKGEEEDATAPRNDRDPPGDTSTELSSKEE